MTDSAYLSRLTRWAPLLLAVALAVGYLLWAPHTADLAGQTARAELFRRSGFVPYWTGWYAGIPTVGYSLTTPALLGWLGPAWLGALAIIATALVVVPLLRNALHPRVGAVAFVMAAALNVISGRTTFAVGAVVALAAVLAAERARTGLALLLAAVATITSPVAGVLLLVVAITLVVVDPERRSSGAALAAGIILPLVALAWLSQGEAAGYEPFTRTSLLMSVGTAAVVAIVPTGKRVRTGAVVAIVLLLAAYIVHSPVGANATRIAVLGAAPTLVAAVRLDGRLVAGGAVVLASLLPLSQLHNDLSAARTDDTSRQFVGPLVQHLNASRVAHTQRVELVDTATHWPSTYLLPRFALARGWERQVDETRNPMFYGRAPLTAATYRSFLDRNAVGAVAVATGVPLDYGATREAALVVGGLPYLHLTWSDSHWRVYAVARPTSIIAAPAVIDSFDDTGITLTVPKAGRYLVRMRWSPYLVVRGGRVSRAANHQVVVTLSHAGTHRLHATWRLP